MRELTSTERRFILHWGEMGSQWGINRTVAQIHALLYLSEDPLSADEIVDILAVARSNVSGSLKELLNWGLIRKVHVMGNRKDHFASEADVWTMFQIIVEERKRREVDPTVRLLDDLLSAEESSDGLSPHSRRRLSELSEFFHTTSDWYTRLRSLPLGRLRHWLAAALRPGESPKN